MARSLRTLFVIVIAFAIAGCDSAMAPEYLSDANPAKLKGKKWEWVGYTTLDGYKTDIPSGSYFSIFGDTVVGNSGGNSFKGVCSVERKELQFAGVQYACSANSGNDFLAWLEGSEAQYRQRDSLLIVVPREGEMIHMFFKLR